MAESASRVPVVDAAMTVRLALTKLAHVLKVAGIETPEHDARLLLAEACTVDLHEIDRALLMGESIGDMAVAATGAASELEKEMAKQSVVTTLGGFTERRAHREPLQYIVGHAPFRFLDLAVGPGVFIPRPETETVVQAGLDWLAGEATEHPVVVDLCAGSGAIGLAVATELPGTQVYAVEASEDAAAWTRRNVERYAADIEAAGSNYHLVVGDATLPSTLDQLDGQVDVILSNPPYVPQSQVPTQPEVSEWDPAQALYGGSADGIAIPQRILARAASLLRSGGCLVMEHDPSQGVLLQRSVVATGLQYSHIGKDYAGRQRYIVASKA
ncbi:protein-(glutamine-N5) methyltransferase, release factor-specific [Bombiscardovia coagulans]|uniref:Release factor glutamine methyltransferase n=2 Tax=Bombiscardovia coagulans TaxID=686666 RepID=A0A261ETL9_9BIFI|nr:protein-(glutamine-N5) methyltransferase, release factor-specific [Bombiscardovia coagulans]